MTPFLLGLQVATAALPLVFQGIVQVADIINFIASWNQLTPDELQELENRTLAEVDAENARVQAVMLPPEGSGHL